jgi:hypothetical protein
MSLRSATYGQRVAQLGSQRGERRIGQGAGRVQAGREEAPGRRGEHDVEDLVIG